MPSIFLYDGRQVIDPAALKPLDSAEIAIPGSGGKRRTVQAFRDELKVWSVMEDESGVYVILGAEAQSHIHYAMPVKGALMCIAIQEIRAEGKAEGMVEGESNAIVRSIHNLMRNLGISVSQAMDALGIPPEKRDRYAALVDR